MNIAPRTGEYEEVICIKSKEIIHIDWGNVEVIKGNTYKNYISGFVYIQENICSEDHLLVEVGGMLWPFPKKNFSTIIEERDKKINQILDGR